MGADLSLLLMSQELLSSQWTPSKLASNSHDCTTRVLSEAPDVDSDTERTV